MLLIEYTPEYRKLVEAIDNAPEIVPCTNDPEAWFPEVGNMSREVKRLCGTCPVQVECMTYGMVSKQEFGIWGGKSTKELQRMRNRLTTDGSQKVSPEAV